MLIRHHFAELIYVLPNMLVLRMKNVWTIRMHHDASLVARRMAIAGNMVAGVKNICQVTGFD